MSKPSHRLCLLTLLDEEYVTPGQVIDMFVNYLSEDELAEMLDTNELSKRFIGDDYEELARAAAETAAREYAYEHELFETKRANRAIAQKFRKGLLVQ